MSLSSTANRNDYVGNGSTATYSYSYRIFADTDLEVTVVNTTTDVETALVLTTDYTVTGATDTSGTIVLTDTGQAWMDASSFLDTGYSLVIKRVRPLTQSADIRNQGDFFPETHEDVFDKGVMINQQQQEEIDRSVKNPTSLAASVFDPTLPTDINTANVSIIVNPAGTALIVGPTSAEIAGANASAIAAAASEAAAAASEAAAAISAAASLWQDVVYITDADSPVAIADGDVGKLYSVNSTAGNVVFNLPAISGLTLDTAWSFGIKRTDASANSITVNRNGTDTIGGAASVTIDRQFEGSTFIPDTDGSPDDWTQLTYGEVPITGAIVGDTDTQDLSNKTFIDEITMEEITEPSTPSAGDQKLFIDSVDNKLKLKDENGDVTEVGSGGGSGSKNYIDTPDSTFETSSNGYAAYNDATDYVDGTGGTSTITLGLTTTASELLEGAQSLEIIKPASDVQFEGVSVLSTAIDRGDRGKVLHANISGDFSNVTTSGDWSIRAYDVTNSAILYTGSTEAIAISNTKGLISVPVYTENTTASIRLSIHCESTDATAYSIFIDEVKLGPSAVSVHTVMNDWTPYTPTGSWTTNTTYTGFYKRTGDTLAFNVKVALAGAPDATSLTIDIPSGLTIDTAKIPATAATVSSLNSVGSVLDAGAAVYIAYARYSDTNTVTIRYDNGSGVDGAVTNILPHTFANTDVVTITVSGLPIVEWANSSNLLNENQLAVSIAKARYGVTSSTANASFADNAFEIIDFDLSAWDDVSAVTTGASWKFTAPKTGKYRVSANLTWNVDTNLVQTQIRLYKNGSADTRLDLRFTEGSVMSGSTTVQLDRGDYIDLRAYQDDSASGARVLYTGASAENLTWITIEEEPDFNLYGVVKNYEYLDSGNSTFAAFTATTTTDITTLALTPGEWELSATVTYMNNGAGSLGNSYVLVSAFSGTTLTDNAPGENSVGMLMQDTNAGEMALNVNRHRVILTADTTYYLKGSSFNGTNKEIVYYFSARRIK